MITAVTNMGLDHLAEGLARADVDMLRLGDAVSRGEGRERERMGKGER